MTRVPNYHREFSVGENPCKPQHYAPRPARWDESAGGDDKADVGDGMMKTYEWKVSQMTCFRSNPMRTVLTILRSVAEGVVL